MIANQLEALLPFWNGILPLLDATGNQTKSNANEAFLDEIELAHLLVFLVYDFVVVMRVENSGHEPIRNVR